MIVIKCLLKSRPVHSSSHKTDWVILINSEKNSYENYPTGNCVYMYVQGKSLKNNEEKYVFCLLIKYIMYRLLISCLFPILTVKSLFISI